MELTEFASGFKKHSENQNQTQFFNELKAELNKRLFTSELSDWEKPIFKPSKPDHVHEKIKLISIMDQNYHGIIIKGFNVSADNLPHGEERVSGSGFSFIKDPTTILAHGYKFEVPPMVIQHLKQGGTGRVFEKNGYAYFITSDQESREKQYKTDLIKFNQYTEAFQSAKELLQGEIAADIAIDQHHKLNNLPFDFYVAIKVNVRLLTESSWGDGAKRNTVTHIVPKEALTGRLKRKENEFLCGGSSSYGTPTPKDALVESCSQGLYKLEVTCKACLKHAESLLKLKK